MKHRYPDSHANFMPTNDTYINPHKGFTTFQRFSGDRLNEGWCVERGWQMEHLAPNPTAIGAGDVSGYPSSSIAYFRIPWRRLEPKDGEYDFTLIDRILDESVTRGQKVMLRIPPHAARPGGLELPEWFCERLALPPREVGDKMTPDHPLYFERYGELIRRLGRHIDGDTRITAVDMSLISAWGEGSQADMLTPDKWQGLVDAYMTAFKHTPISAQFNHPDSIRFANTYRPVGVRADCLGNMRAHMFNHYPRYFSQLSDLWERAPIAFESCYVVPHWLSEGWDIDYIIEQSYKWHITSFNAKSVAIPDSLRDKMDSWIRGMGYRFAIRRLNYPSTASAADILSVSMWIENRGCAPIYHSYPLILRLIGEGQIYEFTTDADVTSWLPGDTFYETELCLPDSIAKGTYTLWAGIVKDGEIVHIATDSDRDGAYVRISGNITIK